MKKILVLLILVSVFIMNADAQFSFQRISPRIVIGDTSSIFPTVTKGVLKNISANTLSFKYFRSAKVYPGTDWITQMCGGGLCYGPELDTIPPYPVPAMVLGPGQSDTLAIDFNGRTVGTGYVVIRAYVHNNPAGFVADTFWVQLKVPTAIKEINEVVTGFKLSQNYPNPFNAMTIVRLSLPKASDTKLVVYDLTGREVEVLVNEFLNQGSYEVRFDAANLNSGVYYYKLTSGDYSETKKMILIK